MYFEDTHRRNLVQPKSPPARPKSPPARPKSPPPARPPPPAGPPPQAAVRPPPPADYPQQAAARPPPPPADYPLQAVARPPPHQQVTSIPAAPADLIAQWVRNCCPSMSGKQAYNLAVVLRMTAINPEVDFAGVAPDPVVMASQRGQAYLRIFCREGRGWQRATHVSSHPHARFLYGGHGTTDVGLLGILAERRVKAVGYAGVYAFVAADCDDAVWGFSTLRSTMEKVAESNKNWCGVIVEVRCRAHSERVYGGIQAEEAVCRTGIAAHASRSNGGRWLLPEPFLDLVALWVPLRGTLADTLPGCLSDLPVAGLAAAAIR